MPRRNEVDFDKMLIEDERGELRIRDGEVTSVMSTSTVSGGDQHMLPMVVPLPAPTSVEHDRFIPQRCNRGSNAATLNFEAKELLFAKKQFNCTHSANEQCDCLNQSNQG